MFYWVKFYHSFFVLFKNFAINFLTLSLSWRFKQENMENKGNHLCVPKQMIKKNGGSSFTYEIYVSWFYYNIKIRNTFANKHILTCGFNKDIGGG